MKLIGTFKKRLTPTKIILSLIILYLLFVLYPIKGLVLPQNWWGKTLIVFMNDSEARPCGGFVTAFGVLDLPRFNLELKNSYHFSEVDYGLVEEPLNRVSTRKKFWDLGTTSDLQSCSETFGSAYWQAEDKRVNRTILIQSSFLEDWIDIVGPLALEGQKIDGTDFFPLVSRNVANVDRHSEEALDGRKQPLVDLGRQLIVKTLLNPLKWYGFTSLLESGLERDLVFWSGYSKPMHLENLNQFSISEWNLGGGKSSRVLRKSWSIDLRETTPEKWEAKIAITATHLGQISEPLSQIWNGGFELSMNGEKRFFPATISPGETFSEEIAFPIEALDEIYLFAPTYQSWQTNFSVSVFPEQILEAFVSGFRGVLPTRGQKFDWSSGVKADDYAPFLVIHKPIGASFIEANKLERLDYQEKNLVVELKFNEVVEFGDFDAQLIDRNFINDATSDLTYKSHVILEDEQTVLVNFVQSVPQIDERFDLTLSGIKDLWGNEVAPDLRTIITR